MRPACVRCSLRGPVWLVTMALARAGATLAPARCFSDRASHELATSQFVSDIGDIVRSRDDYTDLCVYTIRRSDLIERLSRKKGPHTPYRAEAVDIGATVDRGKTQARQVVL